MTRANYIAAVKAKLEEISAFDEPSTFIAASGDTDYDKVKPSVEYIESCLDDAVEYCLATLPLQLLTKDIESKTYTASGTDYIAVATDKVGTISNVATNYGEHARFVRLKADGLQKEVTSFITSESPLYLLQQNKWTRGGVSKPIVVHCPEKDAIEIYSHSATEATATKASGQVWYIDTNKIADQYSSTTTNAVQSAIEEYIVLECAIDVLNIFGDYNGAKTMQEEYNKLLEGVTI